METCLLLSQSKPTYSKCYFEMVSFVHGLVGLTMVSLITSCTITSVACSVARHRRYTFSTIQTRIRRCQAAVKKMNVPGTCLLCTNLEKRMNELIYVNRKPISPLGALQKGLVFKINYICITYNE